MVSQEDYDALRAVLEQTKNELMSANEGYAHLLMDVKNIERLCQVTLNDHR